MSKIIFVTGTDTAVGKTVARLHCIARHVNQLAYIKSIQLAVTDNDAQTVKDLTWIKCRCICYCLIIMAPERHESHQPVCLPNRKRKEFLHDSTASRLGWLMRPLEKIGIYVPGGTVPLPSSLLMTRFRAGRRRKRKS